MLCGLVLPVFVPHRQTGTALPLLCSKIEWNRLLRVVACFLSLLSGEPFKRKVKQCVDYVLTFYALAMDAIDPFRYWPR